MEFSHDLEADLNTLINEYGLISVLESLKTLVEAKAETIEDSPARQDDHQAEAFRDVASALTVLIKALPTELDIEIALSQIAHITADVEPSAEELTY